MRRSAVGSPSCDIRARFFKIRRWNISASSTASRPVRLTAIPMLIIANAYRRLNLWKANTGASFEWVGRAINPYLGVLTGWLMIAAYIVGTVAEILLLGPSVLAVFGSTSTNPIMFALAIGLMLAVTWQLGGSAVIVARRANLAEHPREGEFVFGFVTSEVVVETPAGKRGRQPVGPGMDPAPVTPDFASMTMSCTSISFASAIGTSASSAAPITGPWRISQPPNARPWCSASSSSSSRWAWRR